MEILKIYWQNIKQENILPINEKTRNINKAIAGGWSFIKGEGKFIQGSFEIVELL